MVIPLEIREWLQKICLSLPIGANIRVAGGAALDLYLDRPVSNIDVFITGADIIEDKLTFVDLTDDGWPDRALKFYGKTLTAETENRHLRPTNLNKDIEYREITIENIVCKLYFIPECIGLTDIIMGFDFFICRAYISDLADVNWEATLTIKAKECLDTEIVIVKDSETVFFSSSTTEAERVAKYKEKFPKFKFVKEL